MTDIPPPPPLPGLPSERAPQVPTLPAALSDAAANGRKHPLAPPIDMSRVKKEAGVKDKVKQLLDLYGWFWWMPATGGYGKIGNHDFNAFNDGVFLTIETKFGSNKPTVHQRQFAGQITANTGFSFCVNEETIDHLAWWLESFEIAKFEGTHGREVSQEHGARMLNAIAILTEPWKGPEA